MEPIAISVLSALSLSLSVALFLTARYYKTKLEHDRSFLLEQIRVAEKKPAPTLEAETLLHDLTRQGSAVVRLEVVDARNLMLRSPRS